MPRRIAPVPFVGILALSCGGAEGRLPAGSLDPEARRDTRNDHDRGPADQRRDRRAERVRLGSRGLQPDVRLSSSIGREVADGRHLVRRVAIVR